MAASFHPRRQGDLGEVSALEWLLARGHHVYVPFGHDEDCDLVADIDGRLERVQVKTCGLRRNGRWEVMLATKGGNRTWSGTVRRFSETRCDRLFVLVGDGRRWFLPAEVIGGGTRLLLGGPKYAAYEVDRGRPLPVAGGA